VFNKADRKTGVRAPANKLAEYKEKNCNLGVESRAVRKIEFIVTEWGRCGQSSVDNRFVEEIPSMSVDEMTRQFIELKGGGLTIDAEDWTEADTRSKFIDTVLIKCLEWGEQDIRRELSSDRKRLDYLLATTRPVVVVEAKKANLDLPVIKSATQVRQKINRLLNANPGLREHMRQVAEYCWRFSAPVAVLTNGRSYISFIAVRTDGIKWEDGDALSISDIFADTFNFSELFNLLSRQSVVAGRLLSTLIVNKAPVAPQNVLSTYADPNAIMPRNALGLALEPLLREVFSDVTRDDSLEVLEHCYVLPAETKLRDIEFEALLLDKPPRFTDAAIDISSRNAFDKFQESIKDYLNRTRWQQTLLVIGGIGVGKTMFLQRFFKLPPSDDTVRQATCAFFVDFRKPGLDPTKIPELIYERLKEQILDLDGKKLEGEKAGVVYDFLSAEGLEQVFWPEMQRFLRGPLSKLRETDKGEFEKCRVKHLEELRNRDSMFVRGAFRVLRERYHRHVCVVLDNADQCKPEYQEAVYMFSRTLEENLECLVIVALREEWYWHFGKRGGPLSAYHDIVYHIPAPRVRDVLAKRLEYAINLLKSYKIPTARAHLPGDIELEAKHLVKYLDICRRAFFEDECISGFFEYLSNGSVRKGLDAFLEFLRSGHTRIDEYLKALIEAGNYVISFHQVFKPISRGAYQYYSSARSMIPNIYTPITGVKGMELSYFACFYVLRYLASNIKVYSAGGEGFVPLSGVDEFLATLGVSQPVRRDIIVRLVEQELLEPDIKMIKEMDSWSFLRITAFGLYLTRRLAGRFAYLEAMMLDTPLTDAAFHHRVASLYLEGTKPALFQRQKCVKEFVDYLRGQEDLEQMRVQTAGLGSECTPTMGEIAEVAAIDLKEIEEEIKKTPFI
jgi:hypothetical protein